MPIIAALILLTGAIAVIAYGTSNPSVFGHTGDEVANMSATLSVPFTTLKNNYNNLSQPGCAPNSADDSTKFATTGIISACHRYCIAKGYNGGTLQECGSPNISCLCIN